jgi:hypothetical protein
MSQNIDILYNIIMFPVEYLQTFRFNKTLPVKEESLLPSPVYPDDSNEESFDKLEELEPQALHQR